MAADLPTDLPGAGPSDGGLDGRAATDAPLAPARPVMARDGDRR